MKTEDEVLREWEHEAFLSRLARDVERLKLLWKEEGLFGYGKEDES